jgi:hypothetical protein
MTNDKIKCPKCGYEIPVSEVLTHQIREEESAKLDKEYKLKEAALLQKAKEKAGESVKVEVDALKDQIKEQAKMIGDAQKAELTLREEKRKIEAQKKSLELDVARKIDAERGKITLDARKKADEEHQLKDLENQKIIQDLKKSNDEMKRKIEQGSMQLQGEVMELSLEDMIKAAFPKDDIQPVPKGIKGADVLQKVMNNRGMHCGTIVWESKRTKSWSDGWLDKLKDDQREIGAEIAVIVSETMPKDIPNIGKRNGIWVAKYELAAALALTLRDALIEVAIAKSYSVGKDEKKEQLYNYLTSTEFRHKIEAILETFVRMRASLDKEKRAMQKIWKEREKQIERLQSNTIGMDGGIREVVGASAFPEIKILELAASSEEEPEDTEK